MTNHRISWYFCHTHHDISWHIMTFCHKNKKLIFVAKIYDYALIDSYWGFAGLIDSPTSCATLLSSVQCHDRSPSNCSEKNSFWRVFLFLAGGNANFMWRPNSFRFQALHPSIFRTAANLPIIIIQNVQGLSRKSDFLRPLKPIRGRTSSMMTDGIYKIFSDLRGCRVARWSISPEIWHEI